MPKENKTFHRTSGQEAQFDLILNHLHCMAEGGSRSSKSFGWAYALAIRAMFAPSTHLVVRRYYKDCRQSLIVGEKSTFAQVMHLVFPGVQYRLNHTDWTLTLPPYNSVIWFGGLDSGERMDKCLGREYSTVWVNEASEVQYDAVLTLRSRLAERSKLEPRFLYDQNPPTKSHWTFKEFHQGIDPTTKDRRIERWEELYGHVTVNPQCNAANITAGYIDTILAGLPDRQRRRFLQGEYTDDVENGLWNQTTIDHYRVSEIPGLVRIVVGVDPGVSSGASSHETGIVAAGKGEDGEYYVLDDASIKAHPLVWGKAVIDLFTSRESDRVVGEVNQGGDLVEANLRSCPGGADIPFTKIHARRGKVLRAEPVASLYERGLVHHVGTHRYLEDEMTSYDPSKAESGDNQFNRGDALVYALRELAQFPDGAMTERDVYALGVEG